MDYRQMKLDKSKDKVVTDYEKVPDQRGPRVPLVQPGDFLFGLPKNIDLAWAEPFMVKVGEEKLERIAVQFDPEHPLTIVGAPAHAKEADPTLVGQTVRIRLANNERNRARRGEPESLVSDMYYFLHEGLGHEGNPSGNLEWIVAVNTHAGQQFVAALEWSTWCNDTKTRYIDDGQGGSTEDPEGTRGCGTRYYQRDIPRDPETQLYVENFTCGGQREIEGGTDECGAMLRCFPNLGRFRPASLAEAWG